MERPVSRRPVRGGKAAHPNPRESWRRNRARMATAGPRRAYLEAHLEIRQVIWRWDAPVLRMAG